MYVIIITLFIMIFKGVKIDKERLEKMDLEGVVGGKSYDASSKFNDPDVSESKSQPFKTPETPPTIPHK